MASNRHATAALGRWTTTIKQRNTARVYHIQNGHLLIDVSTTRFNVRVFSVATVTYVIGTTAQIRVLLAVQPCQTLICKLVSLKNRKQILSSHIDLI